MFVKIVMQELKALGKERPRKCTDPMARTNRFLAWLQAI